MVDASTMDELELNFAVSPFFYLLSTFLFFVVVHVAPVTAEI